MTATSQQPQPAYISQSSVEPDARLAATVVRDKDGQPLAVYRGQHGGHEGLQSRLASISFGSLDAARGYAESPNHRGDTVVRAHVFAALLDIRNPFIEADSPFLDLDVVAAKLGNDETLRIARKFAKHIEKTNCWSEIAQETGVSSVEDLARQAPDRISELYFDAFHFFDDFEEVAALARAGFDGAIHHGNGATACELEYKVFSQSQVVLFAPGAALPVCPSARDALLSQIQDLPRPNDKASSAAPANDEPEASISPVSRPRRNRP